MTVSALEFLIRNVVMLISNKTASWFDHSRDLWQDRDTAMHNPSPVYRIWDPRVVEKWVKHGYRELPTVLYPDATAPEAVTLAISKNQELFS